MVDSITIVASSIKGIAIRSLVEDAVAFLASGEVPEAAANERLTEDDRKLLKEPVDDSGWYSVESFRRLLELLRDHVGRGDPDYLKRRGATVAERLLALGVYGEVEYVRQVGKARDTAAAESNLQLTASLWHSFFNFGKWGVFTESNGRYGIVVKDAHDMPEAGWQAVHGFMDRIAQEAAEPGGSIAVARKQSPEGEVLFVFGLES